MTEFFDWLKKQTTEKPEVNIVPIAIEAHLKLVSIHPFTDGNGRTARLFMNLLLMMKNYPPAIVRKRDRQKYINAIETAQLTGDKEKYEKVMLKAVERSLNIYLNTLTGNQKTNIVSFSGKLLKIGELAQLANEPVNTIRFWVNEGLIPIVDHSPGGYKLFSKDAVTLTKRIRKLQQEKRLSIKEIKKELLKK